jgi:ribosomal protein S18 acetylase RimI-like enzyme
MPISTRDLTRDWRTGDAERLARFFNATGRAWPGGGWDPKTPEEVERRFREQQHLGVFVAEAKQQIVSLCVLDAKPDEKNKAYVALLTADPDFHGRGYGKAVLMRAIERVHERRLPWLDLYTWPGNMKAVPLYKKSGFMWSPESRWGVYMQNFTPGARSNPIAADFFRKHDWYATLKRDLSLVPDEHTRGKVRVYQYLWEEDGDALRMVYDRQSWGLVEVETNDFLAACSLEDEKLVAGVPHSVKWRIVNHRQAPLDVVLVGSGDEGVSLDHKQVLRVAEKAELEATFEIDPDIQEKERQPRAAIIRSDLLVNGKALRLEAGFEVKQAVHFSLDGEGQGLRPGRPEPLIVQCRNELSKPAQVKVRITPSPGATLDRSTASLRLPAHGSAELPVQLTAPESGVVTLNVDCEAKSAGRTVRPKQAELYAHVLAAGEVVGHVERHCVVLESSALRVTIQRRGGWVGVKDKLRNRHLGGVRPPELGPPYSWDEFFQTRCDARVEHHHVRVEAVLSTPSVYRPGVTLEWRLALSNLPLVEIRSSVLNGSGERLDSCLRSGCQLDTRGGALTVPSASGAVQEPSGTAGRSLGEHHLSEDGADWPEGWLSAEDREGVAVGFLWPSADRVGARGRWAWVDQKLPAIGPGQSAAGQPVYLFAGSGDSFAVRRWWHLLFGPRQDREQRAPSPRHPLEFGLSPRPLVIHGGRSQARLAVSSVGELELAGELKLSLPQGIRARPSHTAFSRVQQDRSRGVKVDLSCGSSTPEGAYDVECLVRIDRATYREVQPLLVLGDPRKPVTVNRADDGRLTLANGLLALTLAPGFKGSAISLQRDGAELLRSAYPEARPLSWQNPWMGGIEPVFGDMPSSELAKLRFSSRELTRRGRQGIPWTGVRLSCASTNPRWREQRFAIDYLLAPGSAVLAVALRLTHRGGTAAWLGGSFQLWPSLGGSHLDAVLRGDRDARTSRLRCEYGGEVAGEKWVMAENPKTGDAVSLACAGGESSVNGEVFGREGYFLGANRGGVHDARQTRESVFFITFGGADTTRGLAEALSQLPHLP